MTTLVRLSRDTVLMKVAQAFASRGTCNRARVGAVVSRHGRILVTGYNGAPSGLPHCDHDPSFALESTLNGGCDRAVHAEANCIAWAARYGVVLQDAELHSTHQPCLSCAMLIVNAGICRVVYATSYRDPRGLNLLEAAGIDTQLGDGI